ncbi:hypothetical protein [Blastochloris sulfoviridis]|uniref:PepSY domain-containing protein n=1 Tax=Blastochloris sulfoviridis TaxID=50712 RepID=A0A5M6I248_9HYPH|nr:hypothetical protein [Blastochloris sulfoviridis]KAA5601929.1 hypothetical protein F1193_08375 [Blastochloris sulfoviridis]
MAEDIIDVKAAVRIAIRYLQELGDFIPGENIRLEETEYDDGGFWLITLSTIEIPPSPTIGGETMRRVLALEKGKRNYKVFRIDARSGEVKSMKVRQLLPIE